MEALETRLDETQRIATLRRPIVSVGGYVDFGFFVPQGTGVGVIQDEGPEPLLRRNMPSGTAGSSWAISWLPR